MLHKIKNIPSHFLKNPKQLFWFFIIINIIPSILLLFTEPFSVSGKMVLVAFPLGLYLITYSLMRNVGLMQLFLFPKLFLDAFQIVLFYLFGESVIAVDMFLNLATTNATEAGELLDNLIPAIIAVCLIYIPTTVIAAIACKKKTCLPAAFRKRTIATGLIIVILSAGLSFTAKNKNTETFGFKQDVYPVNVVYNLWLAVNKWQRSTYYPVTSRDFHFDARKEKNADEREIYMLVVGEASRAGNWSLWGYGRETNPLLSKTAGLVAYKDAITQANATHKSVPMILSAAAADNFQTIYGQKSIVEAFKEAGFKTIFLSNQTPNRTFTDYFAEEADIHINIRPTSSGGIYTVNNYDEHLLPLCKKYIDSIPSNLFFVLHTYGSHFNYKERYPKEFARFTPDTAADVEVKNKNQLINAYDNSILYTDYFLSGLISLMDSTNSCTALYYTPDHGEDLLDDDRKRFLHASPHPTYYQLHIPILMWFSNNYQTNFPQQYQNAAANHDQPISTNTAFHTMLDVASIRTPYLNPERSLVNPEFKTSRRMYLTDHDTPIFYYNSGLKKQDKIMIEKKGMDHQ